MKFLVRVAGAALGFWIATRLVHGVRAEGWAPLLVGGLLLGLVNAVLRPVLVLLTLPLTIVSLGIFLIVLNGLMVWLVGAAVHGLHIHGLWPAILTSLIISLCSFVVGLATGAARRG